MKKTFLRFSLIGVAVAGILVQYAYFSNHHRNAPQMGDYAYLLTCPPSAPGQAFIIFLVVVLNGLLYGTVAMVFRSVLT